MNSEVKEKGRIAKRIIKILLFTAGFVLITCRLNYALKQTNAVSQSMWKRYSACEGLDTLFVGSSVGWIIVPEMIDSINGTSSFNMSTPSQYFKSSSYVAKFAAKQHPLQRIVLVMGYESLEHNEDYVADRAIYARMHRNSLSSSPKAARPIKPAAAMRHGTSPSHLSPGRKTATEYAAPITADRR